MAEEKIVKRIKLVKSKQQTELLQFITKQNSKLVSAKHKQNQLELTLETMGKKMILKSRKAVSNLGYYVGVLSKDTITIGNTRVYQLQPDLQFMEEELNHQQEAKAIHLTTQHDIGKSTLLQKSEKEPWVGLNVHLKNSGKSAEMRHSFVSGISSSSSIVKREVDNAVADDDSLDAIDDKDFTPKDYLSKISNSISSFKPFSPLMSLSESKNMNLHDRCRLT